jgi:hypothetical protein
MVDNPDELQPMPAPALPALPRALSHQQTADVIRLLRRSTSDDHADDDNDGPSPDSAAG